jgi:hypothetical protein
MEPYPASSRCSVVAATLDLPVSKVRVIALTRAASAGRYPKF